MIIIMKPAASEEQISNVVEKLKKHGFGYFQTITPAAYIR